MADGKVVIQVDMDGNKAQSGVERLKSMMGGLAESGERAGSVFKSILGANVISSALFSGIGTLNSGIREMMSELNSSQKAWKTFEGNLQAFGRSANEIKKAKEEMQDFATKTIYSASDMASTYSQLDAVGTKNVGSLVKAFGGLAASAENPAQAMKSLSTQATQMASKPKIAWMDFKIMMEQAPAGMAAVAKQMGMSTADLVKAVQDGKVKTEDFFDALNRAGNSDAFQKMATEFKTVDQAIDGAKESLSNKLMPAFEQLNKFGIKAINAISDALEKINFDKIAEKLGAFLEGIDIDGIISTVTGAFANIGSIIGSVNTVIQDLVSGAQTAFEAFKNTGALDNAGQAFKDLSEAALDLASKLANAIPWETIGEAAGKIVNFVSQMASSFANFVKGLDPNTIRNVATALVTMAVALKGIKTGVAIAKSLKSAFDFGKNIVSLIGNILGLTAAQATNAAASAAMSAGTTAVGTSAGASASSVMKLGVAVLMVGAGILAAAAGVYVLVQAAMQLASAGAGAQIALLAIVAGIALLAVGAAAIGPALTVGAVGILAFGAAIALIGAGVAVAALGIAVLVDAIANGFALIINTISSNAPQIISIIQAIADGIRTAMDGIANIIISVGTAINIALQGIADIFKSVGESISTAAQGIGKGIESVFNGISTVISSVGGAVRTVLDGIANVFTSIGTAARNAGLGVKSMAEGIQILVGLNLADLAGTLTVVSAGLAAIANSGIATAGPGLQQAGTGLMLIATSAQLASLALQSVPTALSSLSTSLGTLPETLTSAGASMSAFASSVTASFASLSGSVSSIMMLQTGLMSLATAMMMAQSGASAMSSTLTMINASASSASASISQLASGIASAMTQAVSSVQSSMALIVSVITQSSVQMTQAGQQAGRGVSEGITNGIRSGVGSAMSAMATMVSSIRSTAMTGVSAMRYAGSMIGQGLAQGMYSALGAVTAAANALVAQAERAAQAKAKIHSPSRLFRDNVGKYIAQGVAIGILADAHKVDDAMGDVFDQIRAFNFAPEDIIGVGQTSLTKTLQVKSDLDRQIKASVKVVQEKSNRIVEQALEVAEKAVKRPVNMMMESGVLVGQIGQQMTEFQNDKLMIDNMMRGNY